MISEVTFVGGGRRTAENTKYKLKALRVLDTALNKGLLFKLRVDKDKQQKKELHVSVDFV